MSTNELQSFGISEIEGMERETNYIGFFLSRVRLWSGYQGDEGLKVGFLKVGMAGLAGRDGRIGSRDGQGWQ
jgi:hypothetical protein